MSIVIDTLKAWEPLIVLMSLGSALPIHTDDHCIKVQLSISKSDSHGVLGSVGIGTSCDEAFHPL